jgi:hypothetical protein
MTTIPRRGRHTLAKPAEKGRLRFAQSMYVDEAVELATSQPEGVVRSTLTQRLHLVPATARQPCTTAMDWNSIDFQFRIKASKRDPCMKPDGQDEVDRLNAMSQDLTERERKKQVREEAERRSVRHLVHFTSVDNLRSIFTHGLLSVNCLERSKINYVRNDALRLDGMPDHVSASLTFPNHRMFYKMRMTIPERKWAVLLLNPVVLCTRECYFTPRNAAAAEVKNRLSGPANCPKAFAEMFADLPWKPRPLGLDSNLPTDVQAEVLVRSPISIGHIMEVCIYDARDWFEVSRLVGRTGVRVERRYFERRRDYGSDQRDCGDDQMSSRQQVSFPKHPVRDPSDFGDIPL